MALRSHDLTPLDTPATKPDGTTETPTRVAVGWDSLFGAYYLHVWTREHDVPYGYPSITYDDKIRFPPDPTAIIEQAQEFATIPADLASTLAADAATEGFYTGPTYNQEGTELSEASQKIRAHFGLTDVPF